MNVATLIKEVSKLLKIKVSIFISYGQFKNIMIHLERDHLAFDIQIYTI
jgi:hypothetical protein